MNRIRVTAICFTLVLFVGCSKSNSSNVAGALEDADETAALSYSDFTKPIVLHIDPDGFSQAQRLKASNGFDKYSAHGFEPCDVQSNYRGPIVNAYIDGNKRFDFDWVVINRWLSNNQFFAGSETYNIRFADGVMYDFVCTIISDNVGKYLSPNQAMNVHNGLDIPIGRRVLTNWTFRNRYDTPVPGKGNVKVFAGTFTYRIDPIVPIVSFSGEGTATVKMYLNPDNGRWTVANWQQQDPRITLLTNPLEPTKAQDKALLGQ